jgi:hypothetical protein
MDAGFAASDIEQPEKTKKLSKSRTDGSGHVHSLPTIR